MEEISSMKEVINYYSKIDNMIELCEKRLNI